MRRSYRIILTSMEFARAHSHGLSGSNRFYNVQIVFKFFVVRRLYISDSQFLFGFVAP